VDSNSSPPEDRRWAATLDSKSEAISKSYLLTYPDGSRKHIGREERDALLGSASVKQTAPGKYLYTAPAHTFHSFADLSKLAVRFDGPTVNFLPGSFTVVEPDGAQRHERLETPEAMTSRLVRTNQIAL
jgi:hypothetical protein